MEDIKGKARDLGVGAGELLQLAREISAQEGLLGIELLDAEGASILRGDLAQLETGEQNVPTAAELADLYAR